jgi:hypothetical protein
MMNNLEGMMGMKESDIILCPLDCLLEGFIGSMDVETFLVLFLWTQQLCGYLVKLPVFNALLGIHTAAFD